MKNATDKKDLKDFLMEFKRGMTGMLQTKGGLATTAAMTVLGGPIGTGIALGLGGRASNKSDHPGKQRLGGKSSQRKKLMIKNCLRYLKISRSGKETETLKEINKITNPTGNP